MNLTFLDLYIEGFGSIVEPFLVNLHSPGLNIIQANNGEGKTTIFSALTWVCWDTPLKKTVSVISYEYLRPSTWRGTQVAIKFTRGMNSYQVIRCKDFTGKIEGIRGDNKYFIYRNGEYQSQLRNISDCKEYLRNALDMSLDLFKASSLFPQKFRRFLDESGPDKKKVLEEAFEVSYLKYAKLKAEELKSQANEEHRNQNAICLDLSSQISTEKTRLENLQELAKKDLEFAQSLKARIKREANEERLTLHTLKKAKKKAKLAYQKAQEACEGKTKVEVSKQLTDLKTSQDNHRATISKYEKLLARAEANIDLLNDKISELEKELNEIPSKCSKCHKPFTKAEKLSQKKSIKKAIWTNKEGISAFREVITEYENTTRKAKNDIASNQKDINKLTIILDNLILLDKAKGNYISAQEKVKSSKARYMKLLKEYKAPVASTESTIPTRIKSCEDLIQNLEEMYKVESRQLLKLSNKIQDIEWAIKDPLSNSGIKAMIFNSLLTRVNKALVYYAQFLDHIITLEVNMESANKDIEVFVYKKKIVVDVGDFSGGQRQLVDIAINFAINDVISTTRGCNLVILDEIFESLDANNIDLISEIIIARNKSRDIWLVTHRKEFNPINAKYLKLSFKNGRTSLKV